MIPVYNPDAPRGEYLAPVKGPGEFLTAYELGPIALNDPTRGTDFQVWTADCPNGHDIYLSAPMVPRFKYLTNAGFKITELDLAFDQNGRPFFTWFDLGMTKFYWFDPADADFVVTTILELTRSPRCTLDDHRTFNAGNSDIVLFYIDASFRRLFCRVQRERYAIIHDMGPVDNFERLRCVGMSNQLRLQWTLDNNVASVYFPAHRGLSNFARPVSVTGEYIT